MLRHESLWDKYHSQKRAEYPEGTMFDFLEESTEERQQEVALEYCGSKLRHKDLLSQIKKFSGVLYDLQVRSGDYVTVIALNMPQAVVAVYAANRIGAIVNILHPLLSPTEMQNAIKNVNSRVVIVLDKVYPKLEKGSWEEGLKPVFILLRIEDELNLAGKIVYRLKNRESGAEKSGTSVYYWYRLMGKNGKKTVIPERCKKGFADPAVILYSGGTLGIPKGIVLTNGNFNALAVQLSDTSFDEFRGGMNSLALMPIFHGFGLGVCVHGMLCHGDHVFLIPKYDMTECTKLIFRKKIGFLYGVPALFEAISRSEEMEKKDLSFIKWIVTAGDRLPPELVKRLNGQLKSGGSKAFISAAYGLTECTAGCCINPFFAPKEGSIGIPFADMKMKIVDADTGNTVPDGEIGEIWISGPTVMKEYLGMPEETENCLTKDEEGDVWLHSGDLGYRDSDGYYFFFQRKKNMIITAGYNVYPNQIETLIRKFENVVECCVLGREDPVLGQKTVAYVVLKKKDEDRPAMKKKILEACGDNLPQYSIPHEICFLEALPKTSLGKVDINRIKEGFAQ